MGIDRKLAQILALVPESMSSLHLVIPWRGYFSPVIFHSRLRDKKEKNNRVAIDFDTLVNELSQVSRMFGVRMRVWGHLVFFFVVSSLVLRAKLQ